MGFKGAESYSDEVIQRRLPSLYLCTAAGCGEIIGKIKRLYCNLHPTVESRKETEAEYLKTHAELPKKYKLDVKTTYED